MRMCPNVPAQRAIPAALDGGIDITPLLLPGGRLRDQRDGALDLLNAIPGVDCYKPAGALYVFPRLDPEVHKISDDQRMCIDFLEQQHVLLTHGPASTCHRRTTCAWCSWPRSPSWRRRSPGWPRSWRATASRRQPLPQPHGVPARVKSDEWDSMQCL